MLEVIEQEVKEIRMRKYRRKMRGADIEFYILAAIIAYGLLANLHTDHSVATIFSSLLGLAFFIAPGLVAKKAPFIIYTIWASIMVLATIGSFVQTLSTLPEEASAAAGYMFGMAIGFFVINYFPIRAAVYGWKWQQEKKLLQTLKEV